MSSNTISNSQRDSSSYHYKNVNLWCHICKIEFKKLLQYPLQEQINCSTCNSSCEEINPSNHPSHIEQRRMAVYQQSSPMQEENNQSEQQQPQPIIEEETQQQTQQEQQNPGRRTMYFQVIFIPIMERNQTQETQQEGEQREEAPRAQSLQEIITNLLETPILLFRSNQNNSDQGQNLSDILNLLMRSGLHHNGPAPAETQKIEQLKEIIVEEDHHCQQTCPVCFEDYIQKDVLNELPCCHQFHKNCVTTWLKQHNSCPVCRQTI